MPVSPNSKFPLSSPPVFYCWLWHPWYGKSLWEVGICCAGCVSSPSMFIGRPAREEQKGLNAVRILFSNNKNIPALFWSQIWNVAPTMTKINFIPAQTSMMSVLRNQTPFPENRIQLLIMLFCLPLLDAEIKLSFKIDSSTDAGKAIISFFCQHHAELRTAAKAMGLTIIRKLYSRKSKLNFAAITVHIEPEWG